VAAGQKDKLRDKYANRADELKNEPKAQIKWIQHLGIAPEKKGRFELIGTY
jgi:hypothetical protein